MVSSEADRDTPDRDMPDHHAVGNTGSGGDLAKAAFVLARQFAKGATMWCVAPAWPEHSRHVAVEFVHPVIMGKRALPAVNVEPHETLSTLRAVARPGDILLGVGTAEAPDLSAAMRRAEPWGLTSVWLGAGPRPPAGAAHHVLWVHDEAGAARFDGSIVLLYHVLWELTHVCFEHSGLLDQAGDATAPPDEVCITCSDEGRVAEVVSTADLDICEALVRTGSGRQVVDTTVVGPLNPGDLVLVHAGAAITVLEAR